MKDENSEPLIVGAIIVQDREEWNVDPIMKHKDVTRHSEMMCPEELEPRNPLPALILHDISPYVHRAPTISPAQQS